MSTPPNFSNAVATIRSQSSCLVTSIFAKTACPPSCSMSLSIRGSIVSWISQQTTFAPSRANKRAVARPMPLFAPVTMATFPCRRLKPFLSLGCSSAMRMFLLQLRRYVFPLPQQWELFQPRMEDGSRIEDRGLRIEDGRKRGIEDRIMWKIEVWRKNGDHKKL